MLVDFDKSQPDAYVDHLAAVNESNSVIATEDIFNDSGALVAPKGARVTPKLAAQIVKHKLQRPIEESVNFDEVISPQDIFTKLKSLLKDYPDFAKIHEYCGIESAFVAQCKSFARHELLVQKLTVLADRMPHEYDKGVFCAWLGLCVGQHLCLDEKEMEAAFIAGLVHDIGMLHIAPEITDKQGELTPEEWRAVQSHVVVGKLILEDIGEVPRYACHAVLEHHERCDGSGYPFGKFADQLTLNGQLLAICDRLYPVRCTQLQSRGLTLREVIPQLQINNTVHFYRVYEAVVSIIRGAEIKRSRAILDKDMLSVSQQIVAENKRLLAQFELVQSFAKDVQKFKPCKALSIAGHFNQRIWMGFTSSGMLDNSLSQWVLDAGKNGNEDDFYEIEMTKVMQDELNWQFREYRRVIHLIIDELSEVAAVNRLNQLLEQLEKAEQDVF